MRADFEVTFVRIILDSLVLLAFLAVSISALFSWLGFARHTLAWRRYLTRTQGWPRWPSGRLAVQLGSWQRLTGGEEEVDPEAERQRRGARTSLRAYYAKGLLMIALAGLFVAVDKATRALGG